MCIALIKKSVLKHKIKKKQYKIKINFYLVHNSMALEFLSITHYWTPLSILICCETNYIIKP